MKKAFHLLLVFSLLLGFISCGSDNDDDNSGLNNNNSALLQGEWVYTETVDDAKLTETLNFTANICSIYNIIESDLETKTSYVVFKYEYSAPNIKFYAHATGEYVGSGITKNGTIEMYDVDNNIIIYTKK